MLKLYVYMQSSLSRSKLVLEKKMWHLYTGVMSHLQFIKYFCHKVKHIPFDNTT